MRRSMNFALVLLVLLSLNSYAAGQQVVGAASDKPALQKVDVDDYVLTENIVGLLEKEQQLRQEIGEAEDLKAAVGGEQQSSLSNKVSMLQDELADLEYTLGMEKYGVVNLNTNQNSLEQPGNYIVYKPKTDNFFKNGFPSGWQHATIFSKFTGSKINILEAVRPGVDSRYQTWVKWQKMYPYSTMKQASLVALDLTGAQQRKLISYQDRYLAGKPYPQLKDIKNTKYSMDTFYSSSLVWRSHFSSGAKIDLDDKTSPNKVSPAELLRNTEAAHRVFPVCWGTGAVLKITFEPNPVPAYTGSDPKYTDRSPEWHVLANVEEVNGVGLKVTRFTWDFYHDQDWSYQQVNTPAELGTYFNECSQPGTRIDADTKVCGNQAMTLGNYPEGSIVLTVKGTDDEGNKVAASGRVWLKAPANRPASASGSMVFATPEVTPN